MRTAPYRLFEQIKDQLGTNQLFVEIGSERGGGSTAYLNSLSKQTLNNFVTVDVDPVYVGDDVTKYRMSGEEFAYNILPSMSKKVSLILMDGFDWIAKPATVRSGDAPVDTMNAIEQYEKRGQQLNNINSAVSHMQQILGLRPYFAKRCAIMFCDTWFNWQLDTFEGKGAGAVYLLLAEGFKVISASSKCNYIMMARNISAPKMLPNLNTAALNKKYMGPPKHPMNMVYTNDD